MHRHQRPPCIASGAMDHAPATQAKHKAPARPAQGRISPAIRAAIAAHVYNGMSKAEAAREAGISEGHLYNALTKPHVRDHLEALKAQLIQDVEAMRAPYRAQAFEVARELMHNAKSESVRMRAVEFFAGERRDAGVSVSVNVLNNLGAGYEFVPPGARLVDITPPDAHDDPA